MGGKNENKNKKEMEEKGEETENRYPNNANHDRSRISLRVNVTMGRQKTEINEERETTGTRREGRQQRETI